MMLDLETLGTRPGSVILSIGACVFDEHGPIDNVAFTFHADLYLSDQTARGCTIDPDTVLWWLQQKDDARMAVVNRTPISVMAALGLLYNFYERNDCETVWSNGADFDIPLITDLYKRAGLAPPWKYNAGRDVRTIFALILKKLGDFGHKNDMGHHALHDALFQAREVADAMLFLRKQEYHAWRWVDAGK